MEETQALLEAAADAEVHQPVVATRLLNNDVEAEPLQALLRPMDDGPVGVRDAKRVDASAQTLGVEYAGEETLTPSAVRTVRPANDLSDRIHLRTAPGSDRAHLATS